MILQICFIESAFTLSFSLSLSLSFFMFCLQDRQFASNARIRSSSFDGNFTCNHCFSVVQNEREGGREGENKVNVCMYSWMNILKRKYKKKFFQTNTNIERGDDVKGV